jgi:hypothetical protein
MRGECWSFEQGIVLDVPGVALDWASASDVAGNVSDQTWRAFLDATGRARPNRPLDGVVLTLPADQLIGPAALSREDLIAAGQFLHGRLRDMEEWFGLRLPVYVLVTHCEAVAGFDGFWSQVPAERHGEMFGWSNPHSADTAFAPGWMDAAFAELAATLRGVQLSLAAAAPDSADGQVGDVVLFPGSFAALAGPVRTLTELIFQSTAYREGFFLRGVYFSGSLRSRPILVRQMLTRKALLEGGLVRPVTGRGTRRRRVVRRLQIGMAAAVLVLGSLLAWRLDDLRLGLPTLERPLRDIAEAKARPLVDVSHNTPGDVHWGEKAAASRMLMALSGITLDGLTSPLIPTSWFNGLEGDITAFARVGFDRLIMVVIEERLRDSIEHWLTGESVESVGTSLEARAGQLVAEIDTVGKLAGAVTTYDRLRAEGDAADLRTLVADLFHITLPPGIDSLPRFLSRALKDGQGGVTARFPVAPYADRARARIAAVTHQTFDALTTASTLAEDSGLVIADMTALASGSAGQAKDLAQVHKTIERITGHLEEPWFSWVRTGRRSVDSQFDTLLGTVTANAFLGRALADALSADGQAKITRFRQDLLAHRVPLLDAPLFAAASAEDPSLVLSPAAAALGERLDALFAQPFMVESDAMDLPDGVDVLWDANTLTAAVALYQSWGTYSAASLDGFPPVLRPLIRAEAERRVGAQLVARIARSVTPAPNRRGTLSASGAETDFKAAIQSFRLAAQPAGLLIAAFDEIGQEVSRDDMATALAATAYGLLTGLDTRLTRAGLYAPRRPASAWDGTTPLTQVLFDAPDDKSIDLYLQDQRGRAHTIAVVEAGPPLAYLEQPGGSATSVWEPLVSRWRLVSTDVSDYFAGKPGTALAALESFIRYDLVGLSAATCSEHLSGLTMPPAASDPFAARHRLLLQEVWERCDVLNGGDGTVAGAYSRVAGLFNGGLAGRYPFADQPGGNGVAAVTPDQLLTFFAEYDRVRSSFDAELGQGGLTRAQRSAAQAFIRQMDAVREFLAAYALAKPGAPPPAYALTPAFRTNTAYEKNANQILEWTLEVGAQVVREGMVSESGTPLWQWGDPVRVGLRWAKDSPLLPYAPDGGVPTIETPNTAVFAYDDPWSLITLLRRHAPATGQSSQRDLPQPNLLAFTVPTRDAAAQAGPTGTVVNALGFLRLGVLASDAPPPPAGTPAGTPPPTLVVPAFPVSAPVLSLSGPAGGTQ